MKISVVIPSLNQGAFLGAAINSVLAQDHPDVEIIVKDGGSTDESLRILHSFGSRIRWSSAPDRGQTHAINQGLRESTGELVGYLNSDDLLLPRALSTVAEYFAAHPECRIAYGNAHHLRKNGAFLEDYPSEPWDYDRLLNRCFICQPATFWRRSLHAEFGYFDETLDYAMDYEFWLRVGQTVEFHYLRHTPLAASRLHAGAKTLRERVRVHRDSLLAVQRHAKSSEPVYRWLRKLARYRTAEMGFPPDEFPPMHPDHHRAFVAAVIADAAALGIKLSPALLRHLERRPRPAGWSLLPLREALQKVGHTVGRWASPSRADASSNPVRNKPTR